MMLAVLSWRNVGNALEMANDRTGASMAAMRRCGGFDKAIKKREMNGKKYDREEFVLLEWVLLLLPVRGGQGLCFGKTKKKDIEARQWWIYWRYLLVGIIFFYTSILLSKFVKIRVLYHKLDQPIRPEFSNATGRKNDRLCRSLIVRQSVRSWEKKNQTSLKVSAKILYTTILKVRFFF